MAVKTKELYEGLDLTQNTVTDLQNGKKLYDYIVSSSEKANFLNEDLQNELDEGVLSGLLGGVAGNLIGPTISKAICKCLGISESGTLGKLLMSNLVCTAIAYEICK